MPLNYSFKALARGLFLAIAYVVTGKLGLLLALPPGYASPIFPPAGIAIAAVMVLGGRALPWIFLGSLLLNLWVGHDASPPLTTLGMAAAAFIATASTLQAALGGAGLRRAVGYPTALASGRELLAFFLVAPLVCLTSASLSVGGLVWLAVVHSADFATHWFSWWVGDTLGLLVALPLTLVFIGEPRALWRSRRRVVAVPVAICFALVVFMFVKANAWDADKSLAEFRGLSDQAADQLQTRFEEQESQLEQLDSLMGHDPARQVTRQEFRRFTQKALARFPMVQGVEWAPRVRQEERNAFEKIQRRDFPRFEIRERNTEQQLAPAATRPVYYPVTYVEPLIGNEPAVGFDLASLADRDRALAEARNSGVAVATAPIRLVQERDSQAGLLLVRAVTESDRLQGVVLIVLRLGDFASRALADKSMLSARLVDVESGQAVYSGFAGEDSPRYARDLVFGTRHYRLETVPTSAYLASHQGWGSWSVLAVGLFGIGLLCALLLLNTGYAARSEVLVRERTEELQESEARLHELATDLRQERDVLSSILETEPECVKVVDGDGRLLQMNKAGLDMLEVESVEEANAYGLVNFLLPEYRAAFIALDEEVLRGGCGTLEFQIEGKKGTRLWLESRVAPLRDAAGRITSALSVSRDVTRRREAERQLALALRGADLALCDWHIASDTLVFGQGWTKLLGYPTAELPSRSATLAALMHPDDASLAREALIRHLKGQTPFLDAEVRLRHKHGQWVWLHARGMAVERAPDGRALRVTGTAMDISERKRAEENQRLAASVFSHADEGIMICDARQRIIEVNPAFSEITGYPRDEVIGQTPSLLSSGRHGPEFFQAMWQVLQDQGHWESEIWNRRKNGEVFVAHLRVSAVRDDMGRMAYYLGTFSDITLLKQQQEQLDYLAHYDALTQLPNRLLLADRMEQGLAQATRSRSRLAVCYLDLDGFKPINDDLGHEAGDQLLIEVTRRLKEALRTVDTVARLGGDEFVLLLTGLDDVGQCRCTIDRVLKTLAQPMQIKGREARVSASVGITLFPDDSSDADTLLRHADQAMYLAKEAGRNRCHLYDPKHDQATRAQRTALARIDQALKGGELCLYYQPKVDMRRGQVLGFEALLRWQHPKRGLLPPGEFLPIVAETDLELAIGRWVLAEGLRQLAAWRQEGQAYTLGVNISAGHLLMPGFVDELKQLLAANPSVSPSSLCLEIHESVALMDVAAASAVFRPCRELGVKIALDGFGTAYANLSYFHRLQVDTLNIDRTFIRTMIENADDLAVVEGAIGLTRAFDRTLVAEGIESPELGLLLLNLGCDVGQGFGIGGPMPATQVQSWAAAFQPDPAWTIGLTRLSHDDLPLLVAEIDHRSWISDLDRWLAADPQAGSPPVQDGRQCRFGRWYAGAGKARYSHLPAFRAIGKIHEQVHKFAGNLIALHLDGNSGEARTRMGELLALRDALIEQLQALQMELVMGTAPAATAAADLRL